MKILTTRRRFLETVGGALGCAAFARDAGARATLAELVGRGDEERLRFGALDPLVDLLQATAPDELLPLLVERLRGGLALSDLVAATALANARALGGTSYDGYHVLMALLPSYEMARARRGPLAALPVLKVVHRNARFVHAAGMAERDALAPLGQATPGADLVAEARRGDLAAAERALARQVDGSLVGAYERLQELVRLDADVHRVVLSWRAFDLLRLAGNEHAATLLRQELRYCDDSDRRRAERGQAPSEIGSLVPELLERHGLAGRERGTRRADDAWIERLAERCFASERAAAAAEVAAALAEGFDGADVGRALALAATRIVLHDRGQTRESPGKPAGSVHGASWGVHASDSANAWRHIAELGGARHAHATWIAAAFHTAGQSASLASEPCDAGLAPCTEDDAARLLARIEGALGERDQRAACAATRRYVELGHAAEPLLERLREAAVEQDGALHAEKYFRTVEEEHARARAAHAGLHLVALARVTASGSGFPAPGLAQARALLAG